MWCRRLPYPSLPLLLQTNTPHHLDPLTLCSSPLASPPISPLLLCSQGQFQGLLVLIVVVDQSSCRAVCPLVTWPQTEAEGILCWQLPQAKQRQTQGQSGWWDRREEGVGLHGCLSQFQPWETAGLPLTSWFEGVSSHKDQIPGLEHNQRLRDLARRETLNQNTINVDQKTTHTTALWVTISSKQIQLIVMCNGHSKNLTATTKGT